MDRERPEVEEEREREIRTAKFFSPFDFFSVFFFVSFFFCSVYIPISFCFESVISSSFL